MYNVLIVCVFYMFIPFVIGYHMGKVLFDVINNLCDKLTKTWCCIGLFITWGFLIGLSIMIGKFLIH